MTRACALCQCWDRDRQSRNATNTRPEERMCKLGPFEVSKRADDFCFSFKPTEDGFDARVKS